MTQIRTLTRASTRDVCVVVSSSDVSTCQVAAQVALWLEWIGQRSGGYFARFSNFCLISTVLTLSDLFSILIKVIEVVLEPYFTLLIFFNLILKY